MKSYDYDEHENTWSRTYRRTLKEFLIAASPEFTEEFRRVFERRITDMQPSWSESSKVANKAEERSAERMNMQERCDSEAGINNLLLGDSEFERARERQERFDTRISEEKHGKQLQNNYGSTFSDFSTMERRMRRRSYFEIRSSSPILDVRNRSLVEKSCGTYDRWSGANEEYFKDNAFHEDTNEELNDHKQNSEMCQGHIGRCFRKSTVRPTYSGRPARCNNLSGQERHPKIIIPVDSSHHSWEVSTNRMKAYRIPVKHGTSYPSDDDRIRYSERDYVVPNIQDIIGDERISDREQSKTIKRESPLEEIHDSRQQDSDNRKNDSGWWIQGISQAETCGETEVRRQEAYSRMEQTSSQFNEHEESKWTTRERGSPSSLSNDLNFTESQEAELSKVRAASPSSTQIPKKVSIPRYTYKKTETRNGDLYKYDEERYFENEHHEESQPEPEYGYHDGPEIAEIYSDKMSSTDCSPTTKTIIDDDDERINVEIRHRVNVKLNRRSDKTNRPAYVPSTVVDSDAYSEPCRRCGGKGAEQLLRQNQQEIDRNPRIRFDADWKIPESSQLAKDEFFHVHEKIRQRQPLGRSDLLILNKAHCWSVSSREMELTNLKKEVSTVENERKIAKLEDELFCEYLEFQRTLRQIRVDDSAATLVALIIMKADAYWFAARVCREDFDRERQYTKAKEYFMELLRRSETSLKPHDVSRIRILEKLSELFVEYPDRADIRLRDQCIDAYRKALKARSDRGDDEVLDSLLETIAANLQKSQLNY